MKKTKLNSERVLACVTASTSFEGMNPSKHSDIISKEYITGKVSGEEAIAKIKSYYERKR